MVKNTPGTLPLLLFLLLANVLQGQIPLKSVCAVDREVFSIPECAREARDGQVFLKAQYVKVFFPSARSRLAAVYFPGEGWAYIDRSGRAVVRNVATMDNGAGEFHHGLIRVTKADKWGLANRKGALVVPFLYDGLLDFSPSQGWQACTGCRLVQAGEHSLFEGGQWFRLDSRGRPIPGESGN